jgi:putative FmdB family regulatory protein
VPLYEYSCTHCGRFETIRRFSDEPLTQCPKCQGAVQKMLTAPAIRFKGSGWYVNDYARQPRDKSSDAPKKADSTPNKTTSQDSSASGSSPTK